VPNKSFDRRADGFFLCSYDSEVKCKRRARSTQPLYVFFHFLQRETISPRFKSFNRSGNCLLFIILLSSDLNGFAPPG
jgi:hypothetical protein